MAINSKQVVRRWTLNFVTIAFAIALALLFVLVLRSLSAQIAPPPGLLNAPYPDISTKELCEEEGGRWIENANPKTAIPRAEQPVVSEDGGPIAYCQGPLAFERVREQAIENNRQVSLLVFAIGGAIAVASSLLITFFKPIAPGLMLGGIAAFFTTGVYVWILAPGWGRLATIVAIFVILVGIGIYTLREEPAKEV